MTKAPKMETRKMRADALVPHPTVQREMVRSTLKRIVAALDLDGIGVLHVVRYPVGGVTAWWIVDGQTRHAALMHHGFGEWEVDVQVHRDIKDDAAAAALFRILNTRAPVRPFDAYRNGLTEGDGAILGIDRIIRRHGLRVSRGSQDGGITAVGALRTTYNKDEGAALDLALSTIVAAWGARAAAVEGALIEGIGLVYAAHNGAVDQPALVKKLAKYPGGPSGLRGTARALREIRKVSVARAVQEVVIGTYNKGRRVGQLDPI